MLLRIVIPNIKRIIIPPRLWPPFLQDFNTLDAQQPTVFLAWTSNDLKAKREEMAMVLTRAGFQVIPNYDCPSSDEDFKSNVQKNLDQASCSIHILSGEFGRRFEEEDEISYPKYQFDMAKNKSAMSGSKFTTFIWHLEDAAKPPNLSSRSLSITSGITSSLT